MPCWWVLTRTTQLSMAATARVIWLCACVRYCRPRGWCLSVSLAFFVIYLFIYYTLTSHSLCLFRYGEVDRALSEEEELTKISWTPRIFSEWVGGWAVPAFSLIWERVRVRMLSSIHCGLILGVKTYHLHEWQNKESHIQQALVE